MGLFDSEEEKKVYNIEYKKMKEEGYPFHPFATWKDMVVASLILLILVALSAFKGVHMDPPADPTSQYLPRPEWYFMFLFQLLKYFPGWTAIFAVAIIPGIVSALLLLVPFFDKNPYRHPSRRPIATAAMTIGMASVIGLTVLAYYEDAQAAKSGAHGAANTTHAEPATAGHGTTTTAAAGSSEGKSVFEANCVMCHGATGGQIPNVALLEKQFIEKKDVVAIVTNGTPKGMPPFKGRLSDAQIKAVSDYLKAEAK